MMKDTLPTWSDSELAVDEERATAVQRFIYEYEPGDNDKTWRKRLLAVIKDVRAKTFKDAIQAVQNKQESFVTNGGRSERDREQRRRQSLYIRGLDDAKGVIAEAAANTEEGAGR